MQAAGSADDALTTDRDSDRLRVAVIAPSWYEIPPGGYGGIEWICYWLVEGLRAKNHDVLLIGAGRNHTSAEFVETWDEPPSDRIGDSVIEVVHAARAARVLEEWHADVIHDNCLAGPLHAPARRAPTVVTAHGPVDGVFKKYYEALGSTVSLVAISDAQRKMAPDLAWAATVHNAIDVESYPFRSDKDDYCLFLGRMNSDKGPSLAIDAAAAAGVPLVLAGKSTEDEEQRFFEEQIEPKLTSEIRFVGPVDTEPKKELVAKARCLVFPIQWDEPFGIVMVEAMACGTPVVAMDRGSVPEIVEHGVTGFICSDPGELAKCISEVDSIDPEQCRRRARELFHVDSMVARYEDVFMGIAH